MSRKTFKRPTENPVVFHGMITVSPQMLDFFKVLERIGPRPAPVLIRGETGTGKSMVARALHELSNRSQGPYERFDCAALPRDELGVALFGSGKQPGLLVRANGGTVLLEAVGELPLPLQARLMHVLETGEVLPFAGGPARSVDVRLCTTTDRDLRDLVSDREFRADLMYRIRVIPLWVPRLATRDGDVEALSWHFIDKLNESSERIIEAITSDALDALLDWHWPGNVRELRNALEYAYAVGDGDVLERSDLSPDLRGTPPPTGETLPALISEGDLERERLVDALREAGGRKGQAAEILGVSRSTLWRKLKEHRIVR